MRPVRKHRPFVIGKSLSRLLGANGGRKAGIEGLLCLLGLGDDRASWPSDAFRFREMGFKYSSTQIFEYLNIQIRWDAPHVDVVVFFHDAMGHVHTFPSLANHGF
jgi:hypothetical protein